MLSCAFEGAIQPTPKSGNLGIRLLLVFFTGITVAGVMSSFVSDDQRAVLLPTLATIEVFLLFSIVLKTRVDGTLFGELGFIYAVFILAYTVLPGFTFLALNLDVAPGWVWQQLTLLLPELSELGIHLWRHVLFFVCFCLGYLAVRGRIPLHVRAMAESGDKYVVIVLFVVVVVSILCILLLSAPVDNYIDNYTRYDHLGWIPRKFVSLCARFKNGFFVILVVLMFQNIKRYKIFACALIVGMSIFEVVYSFGSRIESLFVLLIAIFLYGLYVKPITIKMGLTVFMTLATLFSVVEIMRSNRFDVTATRGAVQSGGMNPASEFGAVYFTGFHLYAERERGTLPPREFPMFFNDFVSLFMPNGFTRWNPQYWYARNYFPDSIVPPQTNGPISDSAIWGGNLDLVLRALINGAFFAYIVRWFISRKNKWWAVSVYAFCFATSVMVLKYTVFWHLNPLFKTFVPTILIVVGIKKVFNRYDSSKMMIEESK